MDEPQMLRHCVKTLGMRHVVTLLADLSEGEAQILLRRGDRVRAYAATQAVRVLRRVLTELPTNSTVGATSRATTDLTGSKRPPANRDTGS